MDSQAYRARLLVLLCESYRYYQHTKGRTITQQEYIRGFMEAGLVSGVVTREGLEAVIDEAHKSVFGVAFKERQSVSLDASEGLLDIPTWIRRNSGGRL